MTIYTQRILNKSPKAYSSAFTIVELLIVVVVIAILAAITVVAYNGITNRAKDSAALSSASSAGKKVTVYALTNSDSLPAVLADTGLTNGNAVYQYIRNTTVTPNTFCVTATSGGVSAHVAGTANGMNNAVIGPCAGHTGTAPTNLADGSACPIGYIVVPGSSLYNTNAFCVMKYEAKNVGSVATSVAAGTPWVSISQTTALSTATSACSGCHLTTEAEWMTLAQNVLSVPSNWSTGTVGTGYIYSGHNDNGPANALVADTNDTNGYSGETNTGGNQRRTLTLTNGEVIWDLAGNVLEWTSGTSTNGQPGVTGEPGYAWKEWTGVTSNGTNPVNPSPAGINLLNSNTWNMSKGVGRLYSFAGETAERGIIRGGNWSDGGNAGVLKLNLFNAPGGSGTSVGFRVSR